MSPTDAHGTAGEPVRVLVPVVAPESAPRVLPAAAAMVPPGGELVLLSVAEVPSGQDMSAAALAARDARNRLWRACPAVDGTDVRPLVRVCRTASEGIVEAASELGVRLILLPWTPRAVQGSAGVVPAGFGRTIRAVLRDAHCDVAVLRVADDRDAAADHPRLARILVPVRGGPHAELALDLAQGIARRSGGRVQALHLVPPGLPEDLRAVTDRALERLIADGGAVVDGRVEEATDVGRAILDAAALADLVVLGASAGDGPAPARLFGALPEHIAQKAKTSVMIVRTREPLRAEAFDRLSLQPGSLPAAERAWRLAAVAARVDRWFAESNYHHGEFADLRRLVAAKEKQHATVSLVLPTLNEEATIAPIVRTARAELIERVPLVDELLVIDSGSSDRTCELAAAEGARVVQHSEVLAAYGSYRGKGEALWKSLFETTGDIVVWCDTDVRDWEPRMAYGTLGPLLTETRIGYVKGYYQRPIVEGGVLREGGGGRVTELVARPLINLFFPELSGMIQPLAGEYAGRRTLLETIPFFTGYAVEIGHLIDVIERVGLDGVGQVDLERRVHRNQELEGLSRMSFVILQAVMKRLEERRRSRLFAELGSTMKLPRSSPKRLSLEVIELADQERPPMIRIPEYLERRRAAGAGERPNAGRAQQARSDAARAPLDARADSRAPSPVA